MIHRNHIYYTLPHYLRYQHNSAISRLSNKTVNRRRSRIKPVKNDDKTSIQDQEQLSHSDNQDDKDDKPERILDKRRRLKKEEHTRKVTEMFQNNQGKLIKDVKQLK